MNPLTIAGRRIGPGDPMYVITELSGNHNGSLETAVRLLRAAAQAGADAVKLQTYTADTLTIRSDKPPFRIQGTLWDGRTLYDLYEQAHTPWAWHEDLFKAGRSEGVTVFSTPFDKSAIDLLESLGAPAYKIASFEMVDLELIAAAASTGKPLIISTGLASLDEIDDAVRTARDAGARELALMRCNSAYPAPPGEMDLETIPDMARRWDLPVGLSDHTLGWEAAIVARAKGALLLEKHVCLSRAEPGPDTAFSLEPAEVKQMVEAIRRTETLLGKVRYGPTKHEAPSRVFRRSLFAVEDVAPGEMLTRKNVRAIRPGAGLPPKALPQVLGRRAAVAIERGTPLAWDLIEGRQA